MGVQQLAVGGAGAVQVPGGGGQLGGGGTQEGLGPFGVGRDEVVRQFGVVLPLVVGGEAFGLAAQPSQMLAGGGGAGLQELDVRFGTGCGGLAGGAVGSVGALQELGGTGADLVGEAVQLREGGALVALGAGLFGAQVGADADLLVELGRGPVGLAQGGQGGAGRGRVGLGEDFGDAA